jgi:hypothetical protein
MQAVEHGGRERNDERPLKGSDATAAYIDEHDPYHHRCSGYKIVVVGSVWHARVSWALGIHFTSDGLHHLAADELAPFNPRYFFAPEE